MEGPNVRLPPQNAINFALAVHELSTKATKYDALHGETVKLTIKWQIIGRQLNSSWIRTGGPMVLAPEHEGFVTKLINRVLAAGIRFLHQHEGFRMTLRCTVPDERGPVRMGEDVHITSSLQA